MPSAAAEPKQSPQPARPTSGLAATRVESLSDGVFSIVMTLLVLDLRVPDIGASGSALQLREALGALWPFAVGYLMSFVTAGSLWIAHRGQYHFIRRTDRALLWINIIFLVFVSAIPFFTALLARYPSFRLPIVLYGANMICALLALLGHWIYATRGHRLASADLTAAAIDAQSRRILIGPAIYLTAILAAIWWSPVVSLLLYACVPAAFALPSALDRHWHRHGEAPSG